MILDVLLSYESAIILRLVWLLAAKGRQSSTCSWRGDIRCQVFWHLEWVVVQGCLVEGERSASSLEGRSQVNITRNNASIKQREHSVIYIILCDWRRISKRVITKLFWQNPFRLVRFSLLSLSDSKFLKLKITNASLGSTVRVLIRFW